MYAVLLTAVRAVSLGVLLYTSVSVSWPGVVALLVLIASIYFRPTPLSDTNNKTNSDKHNPLRGKPRTHSITEVPVEQLRTVESRLCELVCGYDPEDCDAVRAIRVVKDNTQCVFARKARVWGCAPWDSSLTLEENIFRSVPTFLKFCLLTETLGLDGFVFALPGREYGSDIETFGDAVRRLLTVLSHHDPAGIHCMQQSYVGQQGWVFSFDSLTMFVTTFAPMYPSSHPRYSFLTEDCLVLLQPEISFAQHDLGADTPHTDWTHPKTVRDRIRVAYREAGRPYHIRDTTRYPMSHDMVKPMKDDGSYLTWWIDGGGTKNKSE